MPQGTRPDWVAIRTEYESGVPRREICERYGITYSSLNHRIDREKWVQSRERIGRKTVEAREKKLAEAQAKKAVSIVQMAEKQMVELLELQSDLIAYKKDSGKASALDIQRMMETLKIALDTKSVAKEETHEDQLVLAIRATRGSGADADIPV